MADVFSPNNQSTDSRDVATLAVYLGYALERISVTPDFKTAYVLQCLKFDWDQVLIEAADPATTVEFVGISKAGGFIGSKLAIARKMTVWQRTDERSQRQHN